MKNILVVVGVVVYLTGCMRTDESFHREDLTPKDLGLVERRQVGQNYFVRMPVPATVYHDGAMVTTGGYEWVAVYGWDDRTKGTFDEVADILTLEDYLTGATAPKPRPVMTARQAPAVISRHELIGLVTPIEQPIALVEQPVAAAPQPPAVIPAEEPHQSPESPAQVTP